MLYVIVLIGISGCECCGTFCILKCKKKKKKIQKKDFKDSVISICFKKCVSCDATTCQFDSQCFRQFLEMHGGLFFFLSAGVRSFILREAAKCNKVCKVKVLERHPFEYSEGNLPVALRERNTGDL